jgi:hypothetical protein
LTDWKEMVATLIHHLIFHGVIFPFFSVVFGQEHKILPALVGCQFSTRLSHPKAPYAKNGQA